MFRCFHCDMTFDPAGAGGRPNGIGTELMAGPDATPHLVSLSPQWPEHAAGAGCSVSARRRPSSMTQPSSSILW
jgi:hypothetical protein